jgi:microcin C transport system ATP-binding protein
LITPLLSVRDLSVAFAQGGKVSTAVDRISFDIGKGETVALVGGPVPANPCRRCRC